MDFVRDGPIPARESIGTRRREGLSPLARGNPIQRFDILSRWGLSPLARGNLSHLTL